jgi:hypothetical protein
MAFIYVSAEDILTLVYSLVLNHEDDGHQLHALVITHATLLGLYWFRLSYLSVLIPPDFMDIENLRYSSAA